jgi:hypothetical protein
MPTPILIQGISYKKIDTAIFGSYELAPFDLNGNLFGQVTIEVDLSSSNCDLFLPLISTLNGNFNISIRVIALNASVLGNQLNVYIQSDNLIGSEQSISLLSDGSNVILTPVSPTEWYGVIAV